LVDMENLDTKDLPNVRILDNDDCIKCQYPVYFVPLSKFSVNLKKLFYLTTIKGSHNVNR